MKIRKTMLPDLTAVMQIYAQARAFMRENGNPTQWGESYPEEDLILEDIVNDRSFVCTDDTGNILGTFMFFEGEEPSYQVIFDGSWPDDKPYGVLHRVASAPGTHGVGSRILDWAFQTCGHVRIDTHRDNRPMQSLLKKKGFRYCGKIYIEDGTERIAFIR